MKRNLESLIVTGLGDTSSLQKLRSNVLQHSLLQLCSVLVKNNFILHFSNARDGLFSKRELLEKVCSKKYDVVILDVKWYNCYETINVYNKIRTKTICYFFCTDTLANKVLAKEGIPDDNIINCKQQSFKIEDVLVNNVFQQSICHTLKEEKGCFKSVKNYDIDIDEDLLPKLTQDIDFVVKNGIKWINLNLSENFGCRQLLELIDLTNECTGNYIASLSIPYQFFKNLVMNTEKLGHTKHIKQLSLKVKFREVKQLIEYVQNEEVKLFLSEFENVEIVFMLDKDISEFLGNDVLKTLFQLLSSSLRFVPDYSIDYDVDEIDEIDEEIKLNIMKGCPIAAGNSSAIPEIKKCENLLNALIYSEYKTHIKKLRVEDRWELAKLANYGLFTQMYYYFCKKSNIEALRLKSNNEKKMKNSWTLTDKQFMNSVPIVMASTVCASGKYYMVLNQNIFDIPYIEFSEIDKKIYDLTKSGYTLREIISEINNNELQTDACEYTLSFFRKLEQYDSALFYVDSFMYDNLSID